MIVQKSARKQGNEETRERGNKGSSFKLFDHLKESRSLFICHFVSIARISILSFMKVSFD